jgi:hypothetical protein
MIAFLLCFSFIANGQAREEGGNPKRVSPVSENAGFKLDPDKIVVGGSFGILLGNITLIDISPTVGYLITDNLLLGVGGRYIYYSEKVTSTFTFKTDVYGANIFAQYFFLENFIAHLEYELLNLEDFSRPESRVNIFSIFVGGGYRSMIGSNSFASILLLYNLNDDINSPYTNPIIRINFGFGL